MTGIAALAQKLQKHGRGDDTLLVHMTPKEVAGLQSLALAHGGSLSINPKTGLHEAGFLGSILPTLAGAAASYMFPGAAFAGPLAGGLAGFLMNKGDPMKGLLGALGGWGGSGMMKGLGGLGLAEQGLEAGTALQAAQDAAVSEAIQGATSNPVTMANAAAAEQAQRMQQLMSAGMGYEEALAQAAQGSQLPAGLPTDDLGATKATTDYLKAREAMDGISGRVGPGGMMKWGLDVGQRANEKDVLRGLDAAVNDPYQFLKNNWQYAGAAALPMLAMGMDRGASTMPTAASSAQYNPRYYSYDPSRQYYTARAKGGDIRGGGIASLPPRMIDGPGTGLSDSVPAQIENGPRAALADGEFVVSADVVSALGGGSTKAGSKKLYDMMDRVRQQAHGTKKQVRKVNDNKVMPA